MTAVKTNAPCNQMQKCLPM